MLAIDLHFKCKLKTYKYLSILKIKSPNIKNKTLKNKNLNFKLK